jgi:hypothetical protein
MSPIGPSHHCDATIQSISVRSGHSASGAYPTGIYERAHEADIRERGGKIRKGLISDIGQVSPLDRIAPHAT